MSYEDISFIEEDWINEPVRLTPNKIWKENKDRISEEYSDLFNDYDKNSNIHNIRSNDLTGDTIYLLADGNLTNTLKRVWLTSCPVTSYNTITKGYIVGRKINDN